MSGEHAASNSAPDPDADSDADADPAADPLVTLALLIEEHASARYTEGVRLGGFLAASPAVTRADLDAAAARSRETWAKVEALLTGLAEE